MTVTALRMSRDGSTLAVAWSSSLYAALINFTPKVFDPATGAVAWSGGPAGMITLSQNTDPAIGIDSTGNVIVAAGLGGGADGFKVQKISADGSSIVWTYDGSGLTGAPAGFIGLDASDNIYVGAAKNHTYPDDQSLPQVFLYKISSAGSLVAQLDYFPLGAPVPDSGQGDSSLEFDAFCVTPAGAAVVGGASTGLYPFPPHGSVRGAIASGFAATWSTNLSAIESGNTVSSTVRSMAAGADGNVYAGATNFDSITGNNLSMLKVSNSGGVTVIHSYGAQDEGGPADIDQNGNLYISYETGSTFHFQKMSSSGSVLWDNSVGSGNGSGLGVADSTGFVYLDNVHGARKLSAADGTTVLWTNTALGGPSDSIQGWARPAY